MSEASEPKVLWGSGRYTVVDGRTGNDTYVTIRDSVDRLVIDRGGMTEAVIRALIAEAVAANARAEKAERALRLERIEPLPTDGLPEGTKWNSSGYWSKGVNGRRWVVFPNAKCWVWEIERKGKKSVVWLPCENDARGKSATAAEAIDAAQAALEGGDDE